MANPNANEVVKPYKIGRDLQQRDQGLFIIDLFGIDWESAQKKFPAVAQIVLERVKPQRDVNRRSHRRDRFWLYADSCEAMREGLTGLPSYIATCRTSKHRTFIPLNGNVIPDAKIIAITSNSMVLFSALSSRVHVHFSNVNGGWQGVGHDPVYQHSDTFNKFAFPDLSNNPALQDRLRELGERLDAFRKERLAARDFLTMTGLYNALERYRELNAGFGEALSEAERAVHEAGSISVLAGIHDDIDRATLSAYGWTDLIAALVGKPGGTVPSNHKTEAQLEAEEELLRRLVALNHERAEEEKRGQIRWLRPEYQIAKFGKKLPIAKTEELDLEIVEDVGKPKWPAVNRAQIRAVSDVLAKSSGLSSAFAIAAAFDGRNTAARKQRVALILETMMATGTIIADNEKYFIAK